MEIKKSGGLAGKGTGLVSKTSGGVTKSSGLVNKGGGTGEYPTADELNASFAQTASVISDVERARADMALAKNQVQENFQFWVGVYFISKAQRDAFLEVMGWDSFGDGQWVNGVAECKKKGLPIPEAPSLLDARTVKPRWAALARGRK